MTRGDHLGGGSGFGAGEGVQKETICDTMQTRRKATQPVCMWVIQGHLTNVCDTQVRRSARAQGDTFRSGISFHLAPRISPNRQTKAEN